MTPTVDRKTAKSATFYPLQTLVVDIESALHLFGSAQLIQLGNALGAILSISHSLLHTERAAHLQFSYANRFDLPDDSEIGRFILYCEDLSLINDSLFDKATQVSLELKGTVRPLFNAVKSMLSVIDQFWLLYELERWRYRQKRIATLAKLESLLLNFRGLIIEALLAPEKWLAKKLERVNTPRMNIKRVDISKFEEVLKDPESRARVFFIFDDDGNVDL
jgi:hypothetical protein